MIVDQTTFNIIFGVAGALSVWWMNHTWEALKDKRRDKNELVACVACVAQLEVLVAGNYVRREGLEKLADTLFRKLDRIEEKLDEKQDKP